MDDVGELLGVGDLQIAWARQLDFLSHDETSGALAHDIDRVGQEDGLTQIVCDQDDVELLLVPQVAKDAPQLFAGERVERTKRLVEQQHLGLVNQRAANAGALLHAA